MSEANLNSLFDPKAVAIIGASGIPGKVGYSVVSNLLDAGYQGRILPVNPKGGEILGLPVVASIAELPPSLDLAVICIPPKYVIDALEALGKLSTRAVIVITAGFKEVGHEGYKLEEQLKEISSRYGMAVLGPNCLGLNNTGPGLNATFAAGTPPKGNIAFFSQSGALCTAILDWALGENIGFSKFVSLGNKAVLDESDMLDYLRDDPETQVILGYVESVEDGQRFARVARDVTPHKPVIMIKSGTTSAGAKAASSHTGAMAGSEQAYGAAFNQAGIIRVRDVAMLFNLAQAFSTQPLPAGPNLAIVTNSGGPGIMAADVTEQSALLMASISAKTVDTLMQALPPFASLYNPIDIIGDADAERYRVTLEAVVKDELVSSILVMLTPTASAEIEKTAQAIIDVTKGCGKPVFACFMGQQRVAPGRRILQEAGIPCYAFPEPAIRSIEAMYKYQLWRTRPAPVEVCYRRDKNRASKVLETARGNGCVEIVEFQAQDLLKAYELPVPQTELARTSDAAVKAAKRIGYPVVLKIASPHISHKSDVGGVRVGLEDEAAVRSAFLDVTSRAARLRKDASITGCLVQSMAPKGSKEVIIGFKRDPQFGALIMFGLGGIYVEVLKDIAFRLAPLSMDDAAEMIREIKSYPLLRGVRGEPPVDFKTIEDILLTMSQLAQDFPDIYEAEFNPVLVNHEGAVVADVRVTLCTGA
ncbi:acetate--CoA ligase alpha subunit [Desulfovibrio ferrophilus]|uniref:CoA-binding domain protein n=1 Tax=Desulfovibrio ferrophilus TaxID=241368 RepID=A0A2Z6B0B7_9BACT|nr:acetate--CoA ligase [Desulfovibrio ferrophilus]BBD08895.1 CoA-binding domain protein [Desulfovibrio ferrophilus]